LLSGQKEITFSLRTKDYRTAVERHRAEEARLTVTLRQFWHSFALLLSLRFAGFLALFALLLSPVRKNLTLPAIPFPVMGRVVKSWFSVLYHYL
jgi:hypothetical protein